MIRREQSDKKEKLDCWLFLLPNLLDVVVFALIPMLEVLLKAFRSAVGGKWVGLLNFQTVIENRTFRLVAWNTARFMLVCIPLLLSISLLMALELKHVWAGRQLHSAFLLPMAVPAASVVLVWKLLFHENGLLNALMHTLHLPGVSWMTTGASFWMLVISYLWKIWVIPSPFGLRRWEQFRKASMRQPKWMEPTRFRAFST